MRCDLGLNCSHGYVEKPEYAETYCLAPESRFFRVGDTYCSGTSCNETLDFDHCCLDSATCSTLADQSCPYGYWFDSPERCVRDPCVDSDRFPGDCCKPSEPCASLTCPHGSVYKTNYASLTCLLDVCNMTIDLDRCCDVAAHCDTLDCGHGYTPDPFLRRGVWAGEPCGLSRKSDPTANDTYCPATSCDINRDRDLCCEAAPLCATAFTCPHGFTPWPDTYCDGIFCDDTRDRDICCRPAMSCTALACPLNYVTRFDAYCDGAWAFPPIPSPQPIFSYSFVTGNDEPIRDPWLWQLWGSPNSVDWVILHEVSDPNHNLVPLERKTSTGQISIEVPCFSPMQVHISNAANITCEEGDLIRHNTNCTPVCEDAAHACHVHETAVPVVPIRFFKYRYSILY
eukprot:g33608.t1